MKKSPEPAVNPKLLYALGALVVAALLFVFVINPLFLSPDAAEEPIALPIPAAPDAAPPGEESDEESSDEVEESLEVFNARDPFQQLVTSEPGEEP